MLTDAQRQKLCRRCFTALKKMARGQNLMAASWFGCCELLEEYGLCKFTQAGYAITAAGRAALADTGGESP